MIEERKRRKKKGKRKREENKITIKRKRRRINEDFFFKLKLKIYENVFLLLFISGRKFAKSRFLVKNETETNEVFFS